jgi:soluble cytochrome b562
MNQQQKKDQLNNLIDYRDQISNCLFHIEQILKTSFPDQYDDAYQHWIPQILTALDNDLKWLPRGELTLQDTIDRIKDDSDSVGGVSKFIK